MILQPIVHSKHSNSNKLFKLMRRPKESPTFMLCDLQISPSWGPPSMNGMILSCEDRHQTTPYIILWRSYCSLHAGFSSAHYIWSPKLLNSS